MRYFVHPQPVLIGTTEVTFVAFFEDILGNDQRASASTRVIRRLLKVSQAVARTNPGEVITLEDEDFATLRAIFESPAGGGYNPQHARKLLPLAEALIEASETVPEVGT